MIMIPEREVLWKGIWGDKEIELLAVLRGLKNLHPNAMRSSLAPFWAI